MSNHTAQTHSQLELAFGTNKQHMSKRHSVDGALGSPYLDILP